MLIKVKIGGDREKDALLVVAALSDIVEDDGLIWCEFYPVDLLLKQRYSDKLLKGHPLLDLQPGAENEGKITVMVEKLRPRRVRQLQAVLYRHQNKFLALAQGSLLDSRGRPKKKKKVDFYYVEGSDYLTPDEITWLEGVAAAGQDYHDRLQAAIAIGEFIQKLAKTSTSKKAAKKARKARKQKLTRKERRRLELNYE